ncbi:unnamed protein product [Alopecurus aequalis]
MASALRLSRAAPLAPKTPRPDLLTRDELMDLFHNCIKLASESKMNQKKAWELGLIDHLSEIVQEEDGQTNFQIISPSPTLAPSFEALNLKKFDVAFMLDPLYHQATAQFDQGGAKGLLLYNLGVYGSCRLLFDFFEAPDKCILSDVQEKAELIDLSFAKGKNQSAMYLLYMFLPMGFEVNERLKKIADFLSLGIGFSPKTNAWAGPDHWKYRKVIDLEPARTSSGDLNVTKKTKNKRGKEEPDIDFTQALEHEMENVFAPPKNPKSLLLPANKGSCNNKLPEDFHYQRESLVKLFLLPGVLCLARRRKPPDDSRDNSDDCMPCGPWDDDKLCNGQVDEGNAGSDIEEQANLTAKPRQINKMDIQYDKVSKQVDVHALKEVLWNHIRRSARTDDLVCLTKVLRDLQISCGNQATPHLYFICLLHLANEHSLKLRGRPTLDEINIYNIPTCAPVLCS